MALDTEHATTWRSTPHGHHVLSSRSSVMLNRVTKMTRKLAVLGKGSQKVSRVDQGREFPDGLEVPVLKLESVPLAEDPVGLLFVILFMKQRRGTNKVDGDELLRAP